MHSYMHAQFAALIAFFGNLTDDRLVCSFLCAYLWWCEQSVCREHSDGWQDRKDCFTDIHTAYHCSTEAHLADVPFPRSFDLHLALRQSCSARLKSLVGCGCKKFHRFRVLIKAFLVKKKGTTTAVLSRVAKLRSVVTPSGGGRNVRLRFPVSCVFTCSLCFRAHIWLSCPSSLLVQLVPAVCFDYVPVVSS